MCYNTKQSRKAEEVQKWFKANVKIKEDFPISNEFNGFNHPKTAIICNKTPNIIESAVWGLVPSWANNNWNNNYTLNARKETLKQKTAFKDVMNNRCLVIVNGFYEWQNFNGQKIKYEIGCDGDFFALAGLYDENENGKSYSIITTEAQGVMREVHNTKFRMPFAINSLTEMHYWLKGEEVIPFHDFSFNPLDEKMPTLF